ILALVFGVLLPRPDAVYSLPALVPKIVFAVQRASDYAFLRGGFGKGQGRELEPAENSGEGMSKSAAGESDIQSGTAQGKQPRQPSAASQQSHVSTPATPTAN